MGWLIEWGSFGRAFGNPLGSFLVLLSLNGSTETPKGDSSTLASGGVVARCAWCVHGSMFLGWLPNLYPVEWPP